MAIKGWDCKGGKNNSIYWDQLIWNQCEGTAKEHAAGEVGHEGSGLQVEVAEHFVGAPSAEKADDVGVNVGAEESISASGSEAAGGNISGEKPQ
jgi:hypothetical protein